jgi:hypothetical protein
METDSDATTREEAVHSTAGRPPPIILTANTNLIQLQRQMKNVAKGDFEFRNTKSGTRRTDFEAVKSFFSTLKPLVVVLLSQVPETYQSSPSSPPCQHLGAGHFRWTGDTRV